MRRATWLSWSGVKFCTESTLNAGALPCTTPSARVVSPSCANASLRMAVSRPVTFFVLAVVKSHAR